MTKRLNLGMQAATGRYADGGNALRFALAYYARWIVGLAVTAATNPTNR